MKASTANDPPPLVGTTVANGYWLSLQMSVRMVTSLLFGIYLLHQLFLLLWWKTCSLHRLCSFDSSCLLWGLSRPCPMTHFSHHGSKLAWCSSCWALSSGVGCFGANASRACGSPAWPSSKRWDVLQLLADLVVLAQALLVVHLRHPQRFHLVHLLLVQLLGLALLKFLQLVHLLVWARRRSDRSIPCPYASEIAFGLSIDFRALRTRHVCSTWAWSVVLEEFSNFKGKSFIRLGMNRQALDLLCVLTN